MDAAAFRNRESRMRKLFCCFLMMLIIDVLAQPVIVETTDKEGDIRLSAVSPGLKSSSLTVKSGF